jgi:hypothetical protein
MLPSAHASPPPPTVPLPLQVHAGAGAGASTAPAAAGPCTLPPDALFGLGITLPFFELLQCLTRVAGHVYTSDEPAAAASQAALSAALLGAVTCRAAEAAWDALHCPPGNEQSCLLRVHQWAGAVQLHHALARGSPAVFDAAVHCLATVYALGREVHRWELGPRACAFVFACVVAGARARVCREGG